MHHMVRIGIVAVLAVLAVRPIPAATDETRAKAKPLFHDFMGLNVHTVLFKPDLYRPVTRLVRDYHPFQWDVGKETDQVPRFPMARNGVDWEALYGGWKRSGYVVNVCLMFDDTPPKAWKDLARDAESYGFEFARAFGPSGSRKLVESIEIGNEPGGYDDGSYRTLLQGAARGIRRGDPRMLISTCATFARSSGAYHKNLEVLKGLRDLYDVIGVHSYPDVEGYPTWRRSFPEDPRLDFLPRIREVLAWRDIHAPGKPVWLTEFGWDATTKPQATEGTFQKWVGVSDEQQAQYLVRAFLTLVELDLDRAYIFFFNDDDKAEVHGASGLTRGFRPKPAFHAVAHLLATLGDYRLGRVVREKPGEAVVAEFRHGIDPDRSIWVAWAPTGEGRNATARLRIPAGKIERAERMPLKGGPAETVRWARREGGDVELEIGESPAYLWLRK